MYTETRDKQINYYLKLSGATLLGVLSILAFVWMIIMVHQVDNISATKTITVSGYASTEAKPDIRTIYISISGKGTTEKLAQNEASLKSKEVSDALKSKNISSDDIKNQSLSTYPEYKNESACPGGYSYRPCVQNSIITGYNTTQSIEVTLRGDLMDKAADIVAELTNKGVTVQTGEATIENPEKTKSDLRAKAITDARKNAEKLADALGVRLGKVQSFNEDSGGYIVGDQMMKNVSMTASAEPMSAPVISNGSQKITSTVNVSFEIR